MDIEYFLKSRTAFIRYFYDHAVRPFNEIKIAIGKKEEPYIPPYSEDGEPPFIEEWRKGLGDVLKLFKYSNGARSFMLAFQNLVEKVTAKQKELNLINLYFRQGQGTSV